MYSIHDPETFSGTSYYKVDHFDRSGNLIDSKESVFISDIENRAFISPNPSLPNLIRICNPGVNLEFLKIHNISGQEIPVSFSETDKIIEVHPSQPMAGGFYILSFIQNGNAGFLRFLVE